MTFGQLMQYVRENFKSDVNRNGSMLRNLYRRFREDEVEAMVKGAKLLGWRDLRAIHAKDGLGRRWAMQRFWDGEKRAHPTTLKALGDILHQRGLV